MESSDHEREQGTFRKLIVAASIVLGMMFFTFGWAPNCSTTMPHVGTVINSTPEQGNQK